MLKAVAGCLVALALAVLPSTARAQQLPSIPSIPIPNDLGGWLQGAANTANTATRCPQVEIAPNVHVPVCANSLPKPPTGIIIPEFFPQAPAVLQPSVDLRAQGIDGPVKNQEQTGVCYAFALTTALEGSLRRQGRPDVLSPLHVVAAGTWYDLWGSSRPSEAITVEASWPYDPIKACKFERGPDECEQSYNVRTGSWQSDPVLVRERDNQRTRGVAFAGKASAIKRDQVQGIVNALASGRTLYAEINIDSRAWGFRGINNGVLGEYDTADRGGHAVALVGYRSVGGGGSRQFLIHNSWGKSWGEGGYAWMNEASLRKHVRDVWVVDATPTLGAVAIPLPTPKPQAPSTTCASGTAIDAGTGRCVAVCRSGLAPFMGQCWLG